MRRTVQGRPSPTRRSAPTKMAPAVAIRVSVADWHSLTKASHWGRVPDVADGSGPAPMEAGLKKAATADSDDVPGPHVPPAAGAGRGVRAMVTAAARNPTHSNAPTNRM